MLCGLHLFAAWPANADAEEIARRQRKGGMSRDTAIRLQPNQILNSSPDPALTPYFRRPPLWAYQGGVAGAEPRQVNSPKTAKSAAFSVSSEVIPALR